jgi:hypothetical protein
VAERRRGWRIVGKDLTLFLRPGAPGVQVEPGTQYAVLVGGEFTLSANSNKKAVLRIHGEAGAPVLRVEAVGAGGGASAVAERRHGSYFIWDGHPYAVFRSDLVAQDAKDNTVGTLVFTKSMNGRPVRVHVLGRAAANLIGSKVGGTTGYIEGALLHDRARRLVLTLDPELQAEAYYVLKSAVDRLPKNPPANINRERYAAMTILDAATGHVLANAGLPGYDPAWEGSRLILLSNTGRITYNAANFAHMPGSAVKILTSAMGYLLSGKGSAEMLPASVNRLAVQQSFQNAFGAPLPAEDFYVDDSNAQYAHATTKGEDDFRLNWRPKGLRPDFVSALKMGFRVAEVNTDPLGAAVARGYREDLIQDDKLADSYFDKEARFDFFPEGSRLPLSDAANLETFLMMSQGGSETKFTTLRLAAILGTISSGKVMHPYLIESVYDESVKAPRNRVSHAPAAYTEFRAELENLEGANGGNVSLMSRVVREYLGKVCSPGRTEGRHTGFYINKRGAPVYMTQDDPATPEDEHETRRDDFGKTGTADHGKEDQNYDDSVFVYQHGRYIIAIWLERADGGGVSHSAHAALNEMVSFIDRLEPQRQ